MYSRYNYWHSLYENNWAFTFYCHKNFVNYSNFRAVFFIYFTVEIFLSSSWHFEKKCRAVEIRADGFWAVHPDSTKFTNYDVKDVQWKQLYLGQCQLDNINRTITIAILRKDWLGTLLGWSHKPNADISSDHIKRLSLYLVPESYFS